MQEKKDKITAAYVQIFHGELKASESVFLALALITWRKLSWVSGKLPLALMFTEDLPQMPRNTEEKLQGIGEHFLSDGFIQASRLWGSISQRSAVQALEKLFQDGQRGLLDDYDPCDLIFQDTSNRQEMAISPELADLLVEIASPFLLEDAVYLPWEQHGQLLGRVLKQGGNAAVECLGNEQYLDLIRMFYPAGNRTLIQASDPVRNPSYTQGARLTNFKISIAFPPIGARVQEDLSKFDAFDRFPDHTTSHTVLAIRHVMAQTDGRAVIVVPNGFLSSAGAEKSLRKDLMYTGGLEAVVALPPGQISGTSVSVSVLLFNTRARPVEIRMVNCATEEFFKPSVRNAQRLLNVKDIAARALGRVATQQVRMVSREEIQDNDLSFFPGRYVTDKNRSEVDDIIAAYEQVPLEKIAKIIRTLPLTSPANPITAFEVGAVDLTDSGYLVPPTKKVDVQWLDRRDDVQFLQPDDLVFVFKGSVGKVGICPKHTPPPGPNGWVVGQSMVILRCDFYTLSPEVLVMLLRSSVGKDLISRVTAGATALFMPMSTLKQLKIPIPSKQQSHEIEKLFQKQVEVQFQIQSLQRELNEIKFAEWSINT